MKIIGGRYKGRPLCRLKDEKTRPTLETIRKSLFDRLSTEVEGARFLDLFAGSGAVGLEALSRGASHVTFVEKSRKALSCISQNIDLLKVASHCSVIPKDASLFLQRDEFFSIIFADPPYDFSIEPLLPLLIAHLETDGTLIVERSARSIELQGAKDKRYYGESTLYFFSN